MARERKGQPLKSICLSEGDIIILPDGRKAVVTGRPSDSSCTYRTDKGKEGTIDGCYPKAYNRRYGYVDPESKTFTDNDVWFSKSIAIIDTPDCCIFCPFSESNNKGKSICMLMWAKMSETGEWHDVTVYDVSIKDLTKEKMEWSWRYRDPRCPLVDLTPYQRTDISQATIDFHNGLEREEFKIVQRSKKEDG